MIYEETMIDKNRIPAHVAIIMDGNGRWASKKGLPKLAGHNAGMLAMKEIVKRSDVLGVKYLTVYAFSTENWKRSKEEVGGIFKLLVKYVDSELSELHENNVKVRILGDYSPLPAIAVERLEKSLKTTRENTGLQFNIALNYGSRAEIIRAVNRIREDQASGVLLPETPVDETVFARYLYTGDENGNIPDPDLIIRTSGEERLSNFMLWQSAYSEFEFTDCLWPDFTPEEYERLIENYQKRDRRFGGRK
ncbi:isoprenyl transferase [Ihubacter sp. rT4E-8]|uniref:isoprenyl transferase n=1 Tax=unclassified Ihubacter TaxID=2633299 RepID=UPI003C7E3A7A